MKRHRFYCPEIKDQEAVLSPSETHHLGHVLRLNPGETIEIFDGKGKTAEGEIESVSKKCAFIRILDIQIHPEPKSRVILAVSMAKSQRFDFLVEKCTELGADHIAAVQFDRTVKQGTGSCLKRCEKICISAAKQSGRVFLPRLTGPCPFLKTIEHLRKEYPQALLIYGEQESESHPFQSATQDRLASFRDIIAVIGPEGGISEPEKKVLQDLGAFGLCINPNVLRIETAAIAFCTLLASFRS